MMSYEKKHRLQHPKDRRKVQPIKKIMQNNPLLTLYHNLWYLLEKLSNYFPCVKQTEVKHNWISNDKR